ncbi:MAG TPA: AcvB/VirJ family lysyl-phosphatidylglycerol hydrolase [Steroidobacteraceae bacterium]|nr:AcvB/VirJ family lysyl-phosphatidylglycerol hydrolase [Steroidobacteraceae bacterium]
MTTKRFVLLIAGVIACASCGDSQTSSARVIESTLDGGRFRTVYTFRPAGDITNVALLFSGDGGWSDGMSDMARRLAGEGFLVGGVDTTTYIESIQPRAATDKCTYAAGDMEALSQHLQWKFDMPAYLRPVLIGYSAGSSLVYTSLAQSNRGTFAGGVGLSFCAEMDLDRAKLCKGTGFQFDDLPTHTQIELKPSAQFPYPWTVVHGDEDDECSALQTRRFVSGIPAARLISLPRAGHDLEPLSDWWPRLRKDYRAMVAGDTAAPRHVAAAGDAAADALAELPIIEVPATAPGSDLFAVMISGDGGWAALDQGVTKELAAHGIPTAGLNSLKYFWHARDADTTAQDVNRMITHYAAVWNKHRVLLIGYSFGADVMPSVFNRLPAETRVRAASVSLLGLGPAATYEVTVGEWLPGADAKGDPVVPEVQRMPKVPLLCIQGKDETDTQCPALAKLGAEVRTFGEGHHFGGLYSEIAAAILQHGAAAPSAPASPSARSADPPPISPSAIAADRPVDRL